MNHFKSLKIGNNPLLVMGCTIIAFGVTHFYFKDADSSKIAQIIGHIMLSPVYMFEEIANWIGFENLRNNSIIIFLVLLFSYSSVVLITNKIFEWRRSDQL